MADASSARPIQPDTSDSRPEVRQLFLKPDRPRAIDEHIDFFGGAIESQAETEDDACGDSFLEELA